MTETPTTKIVDQFLQAFQALMMLKSRLRLDEAIVDAVFMQRVSNQAKKIVEHAVRVCPEDLRETVSYLLAALADELLLYEIDWQGSQSWQNFLLEERLWGSSVAGRKIFEDILMLGTQGESPEREQLLVILYLLQLELGFEGEHRRMSGAEDDSAEVDNKSSLGESEDDDVELSDNRAPYYRHLAMLRTRVGEISREDVPILSLQSVEAFGSSAKPPKIFSKAYVPIKPATAEPLTQPSRGAWVRICIAFVLLTVLSVSIWSWYSSRLYDLEFLIFCEERNKADLNGAFDNECETAIRAAENSGEGGQ